MQGSSKEKAKEEASSKLQYYTSGSIPDGIPTQ
jgi:hypothetical protein